MGPKPQEQAPAKKPTTPKTMDTTEVVTELQRQMFEIQLEDIQKKLERTAVREEHLKSGTTEIEEKIEEFEKEKGAIITELEQELAVKEQEKMQKREEMLQLSNEIKIRVEKHKKHAVALEKKYSDMIMDLKRELAKLEEDLRILEDHKQNRNFYSEALSGLENHIVESEMQHQRNLFEIQRKWEMAKVRVKKELESRLLHLSIEFQQTSQNRIGDSCHRVTQENKAMENELKLMRDEILEYEEKYQKSKSLVAFYKSQQGKTEEDKEKVIARTVIQKVLKKCLIKERVELLEKLREFAEVDALNKTLSKKFKTVGLEIEKKIMRIEELKRMLDDKAREISEMSENTLEMKKNVRRLRVVTRNALKVAEEAAAVRIIPKGISENERFMTNEARMRVYQKRRDNAFQKKGKSLHYLLDLLSKVQIPEEDKKELKTPSEESIKMDVGIISGKMDKELDESSLGDARRSLESDRSDRSLPRSISIIQEGERSETELDIEVEEEQQKNVVALPKEESLPPQKRERKDIEEEREGDEEEEVGEVEEDMA